MVIVHIDKAHTFLCIHSGIDWFQEKQLFTPLQIMRPFLKMLKSSGYNVSEVTYRGIWRALRITNNNSTVVFIPLVCPQCFPRYADAGKITKEWERDHYLRCHRCEKIWKEEAFELVDPKTPHKRLQEFL